MVNELIAAVKLSISALDGVALGTDEDVTVEVSSSEGVSAANCNFVPSPGATENWRRYRA